MSISKVVPVTDAVAVGVTRHTTNAFMRLKLGRELHRRHLDATIHTTAEDHESPV